MSNLSHPFKWLQCADGSLTSLLDLLHFPFPNRGHEVLPGTSDACWEPQPFEPPSAIQHYITEYDSANPVSTLAHLFDCTVCMLVSAVVCIVCCLILHCLMNRLSGKFAQIRPEHKKWYVVVNVMKGAVLGLMFLNSRFLPSVFKVVFGGEMALLETKRTTALYVMTDVVAIILVPKLPFSTLMHHVMTVFIGMGIWSTDLTAQSWEGGLGVVKMSFLYGSFSCIPFTVNIFLGLRVLFPKNLGMILVSYFALITYLLSIGLNWSIHVSWLYHCVKTLDLSPWIFLYGGILMHIIRDDIILVKFLWNFPASPKNSEKAE